MPSTLDEIQDLVRSLENESGALGACLIGSHARGASNPDEFSDIDVVVLVADQLNAVARQSLVRRALAVHHDEQKIELRTIGQSCLQRHLEQRTVYGAHLAREARVLFDHQGTFANFRAAFPAASPVQETGDRLRARFSLYRQLDWCNGRYLFCLADLYAIGRSGAMLGLAQLGVFEFDRRRVFRRFADCHPSISRQVGTLGELEPFYMIVKRKATNVPIPFSPTECHKEAGAARNACNALLARLQ